jgi:hypothetical protein
MQILYKILHKLNIEVNRSTILYVTGLFLTSGEKNCATMARELFVRAKTFWHIFLNLMKILLELKIYSKEWP